MLPIAYIFMPIYLYSTFILNIFNIFISWILMILNNYRIDIEQSNILWRLPDFIFINLKVISLKNVLIYVNPFYLIPLSPSFRGCPFEEDFFGTCILFMLHMANRSHKMKLWAHLEVLFGSTWIRTLIFFSALLVFYCFHLQYNMLLALRTLKSNPQNTKKSWNFWWLQFLSLLQGSSFPWESELSLSSLWDRNMVGTDDWLKLVMLI